jgi:hypothetical protein
MTRKDFEIIARALRKTMGIQQSGVEQMSFIQESFLDVFMTEFNRHVPNFDRAKFYDYCTGPLEDV